MSGVLQVISGILTSLFSFFGRGKDIAVELAGYKRGEYYGQPATLVIMKVSNTGRNANSIIEGYDFELRLSRSRMLPGMVVPLPDAQHPRHIIGASINTVKDGTRELPTSSETFDAGRWPVLDVQLPAAPSQNIVQVIADPYFATWAPGHIQTTMFQAAYKDKGNISLGVQVGGGQIPFRVHGGVGCQPEVEWTSNQNYTIFSRQVSREAVRFIIRGPGKRGSGLPSVLLVGVVVCHRHDAKLQVFPSSATWKKYVIIRKAVAIPTTAVHHNDYLQTCGKTDGSCDPRRCNKFSPNHTTNDMWRQLIGCEVADFSVKVRSTSRHGSRLGGQGWVGRRP